MINVFLGHVKREVQTVDNKREDVVLMDSHIALAIDGPHHFVDHSYRSDGSFPISCAEVQATDLLKCQYWLSQYLESSYIRMPQDQAWYGYPVNPSKDITFDFVNATKYVIDHPQDFGGKVVFFEKSNACPQ